MTFGRSPASIFASIERHLRNSHALGKLIVDTAASRLIHRTQTSAQPARAADDPKDTADVTHSDLAEPVVGLPLPEDEWAILTSGDVVSYIDRSDDETVRAIGRFEESHRRRRLVIEAVRRRVGT